MNKSPKFICFVLFPPLYDYINLLCKRNGIYDLYSANENEVNI